jgi:hypothetical protein
MRTAVRARLLAAEDGYLLLSGVREGGVRHGGVRGGSAS